MADLSTLLKPVSTATATPTVAAPAAAGAGLVERIDAALQGILTDPVRLEQTAALLSGSNRGGSRRVGNAAGQLAQSIDRRTALESDLTSAQTNRGVSVAQEERLADSAAITDAGAQQAQDVLPAQEARADRLADSLVDFRKNTARTQAANVSRPSRFDRTVTGLQQMFGVGEAGAVLVANQVLNAENDEALALKIREALENNNMVNQYTPEQIDAKTQQFIEDYGFSAERALGLAGAKEIGLGQFQDRMDPVQFAHFQLELAQMRAAGENEAADAREAQLVEAARAQTGAN